MPRIIFFLLFAVVGIARASEVIDAPSDGSSTMVTQPHVTAELIPESTSVQAGKPFGVALHLHMDPGWHTYWINPGDAGIPTTIKWTLPAGFTAGPIQWPVPEKHTMGPETIYGYDGDVYLLTTITPPKTDLPQHFDVKAKAGWLVCKEECVPGRAELTMPLDSGLLNLRMPQDNTELFAQARKRLPVENTRWEVSAAYGKSMGAGDEEFPSLGITLKPKPGTTTPTVQKATFLPELSNVLATMKHEGGLEFYEKDGVITLISDLQQNGDKPDKLSGVLVSDQPLIGGAKAVQIAEFPVSAGPSGSPSQPGANAPHWNKTLLVPPDATPSAPLLPSATTTPESHPLLIVVLAGAFIGGLILNLMPCVLPVLSLKIFSLIRHAGNDPKAAWVQGAAFTAGVVLSFWALAGALLALRAAGNHLGWGFQMQSPGFVLALIVLFFLIALNLFGVFEIGGSLVGLDAKAGSRVGGSASSFLNGALATLAATPCTAPFMGSALGFAAQQPAAISMLICTFLALGMATPYLLLTIFPAALRFVPKPGAWMESLKQFMGFLLMATVIWLAPIYGSLSGPGWLGWLLFGLLFVGMGAWAYGHWGALRTLLFIPVAALALYLLLPQPDTWQPWSEQAVQKTLEEGHPVFVDFTAAWCLSCKVNEKVALDTDTVKSAFAQKDVALFRADWTRADPKISATLQQYQRDGVPLYLLYSPKAKETPQVLPVVLTPGIVLDALNKI